MRRIAIGFFSISLASLLAILIASSSPAKNNYEDKIEELGSVRYQSAQKGYDLASTAFSRGEEKCESVYEWSKYILEAQRDNAKSDDEKKKSFFDHENRMKMMKDFVDKENRLHPEACLSPLQIQLIDYYYKEAVYWRAKSQQVAREEQPK
jgi:hypothetical protein